ncbi:MAG: hypothetical protein IJ088_09285 [Clostridia bacterium]|nr:hypothetical protein [Clostridia bacterium]
MKKWIVMLALAGLLLGLMGSASALTTKPVMPQMLHDLVAGKTFKARMDGYVTNEDRTKVTLSFTVCEQESYLAEEVERLTVGDTLVIGGEDFVIMQMEPDETGYKLTGEGYSVYLINNGKGIYTAITDTENRFYKTVFSIEVPVTDGFRFLDYGNPEATEPTELSVTDLLDRYSGEQMTSTEENTVIVFDADGNLNRVEYHYTPWN